MHGSMIIKWKYLFVTEHKALMIVNLDSPASLLPPKRYQIVDQARTLGVHSYLLQNTSI
jgi:hypothetical protein